MIIIGGAGTGGGSGSSGRGFLSRVVNNLQRSGARRGGRVGRFFSSWNARSDRRQFRKNHTMGF